MSGASRRAAFASLLRGPDPQSQILYEVYLNGVRNDDGVIGYGSTVTYCRAEGPTTIVLRAVDTSGNVSGPSNEIVFNC